MKGAVLAEAIAWTLLLFFKPSSCLRVGAEEEAKKDPPFCRLAIKEKACANQGFRRQCPQRCGGEKQHGNQIYAVMLKGLDVSVGQQVGVEMSGRYVGDASLNVGGMGVFRKKDNTSMIYMCQETKAWQVTISQHFPAVMAGQCMGFQTKRGTLEFDHNFVTSCPPGQTCSETLVPSCNWWPDAARCVQHGCYYDGQDELCRSNWDLWRPVEGPMFQDIGQGELGTCYFLASIGAVAYVNPTMIANMFHDSANLGKLQAFGSQLEVQNAFKIKFFLDQQNVEVAVDDRIPVNVETMEPFFEGFRESTHMWPVVLEKAWAKIFGGYKAVEYGYGVDALRAITRAPASIVWHDSMQPADLGNLIHKSVQSKWPVVVLSQFHDAGMGIAKGHAYTLLNATTMTDPTTRQTLDVVHLYNPWGHNRYRGAIPNVPAKDGTFWMLWSEFLASFQGSVIAKVHEGYVTSTTEVPVLDNMEADFIFTASADKPMIVTLSWPNARTLRRAKCPELKPQPLRLTITLPGGQIVQDYDPNATKGAESFVLAEVPPSGGGKAQYSIKLQWRLKGANAGAADWVDTTILGVYAQEEVILKPVSVKGDSPQSVNDNEAMLQCKAALGRTKNLDNLLMIQVSGQDEQFPPVMNSIADEGQTCGDSAQGLSASCEKYNHWASFDSLMTSQSPEAPEQIDSIFDSS